MSASPASQWNKKQVPSTCEEAQIFCLVFSAQILPLINLPCTNLKGEKRTKYWGHIQKAVRKRRKFWNSLQAFCCCSWLMYDHGNTGHPGTSLWPWKPTLLPLTELWLSFHVPKQKINLKKKVHPGSSPNGEKKTQTKHKPTTKIHRLENCWQPR